MSTVDTRVVEMRFDNRQFEQGVKQTQLSVENLKKSLDFEESGKSLKGLNDAAAKVNFESMARSLEKIQQRFSTFGIVGMNILNKITDSAVNTGRKLVNLIQKPIDIAINKGRDRAAAIDDAKFKLQGLKIEWDEQRRAVNTYEEALASTDKAVKFTVEHMTEEEIKLGKVTDSIADDIDYGVKDTAYGLDAAASVAAQLVASQVQVGDGMRSALRGISGVAAMTSSTYEDIGRIFTSVAGQQRVMGDDLNSLAARGLNAAATLKDYFNATEELQNKFVDIYNANKNKKDEGLAYGVEITEKNIREMVSKGAIDFETFATAMDKAFGAQAKKGNETFAGSLSNISSALSRIGALFQGPFRQKSVPLFNAIRTFVNSIKPLFEPMAKAYERIYTTISEKLVKAFNRAEAAAKGFVSNASGWNGWKPFQDGVWAAGEAINSIIEIFSRAVKELFGGVNFEQRFAIWANKFSSAMHDLYGSILRNSDKIKSVFQGFFSIFRIIGQVVGPIIKGIGQLISYFFGFDSAIFSATAKIGDFIKNLADSGKVAKVTTTIIQGLVNAIKWVFDKIAAFVGAIKGGIDKVKEFFQAFKDGFGSIKGKKLPNLSDAAEGLKERTSWIKKVGNGIKDFFSNIGKSKKDVQDLNEETTNLTDTMKNDLGKVGDKVKPALKKFGETVRKVFEAIWKGIVDVFERIKTAFKKGGTEEIAAIFNGTSIITMIIGSLKASLASAGFKFGNLGIVKIFKRMFGVDTLENEFARWIKSMNGKSLFSIFNFDLGGKLGKFLDGLNDATKKRINIEAIKNISKALLVLSVALFILSTINQEQLQRSMIAISVLMGELSAIMVLVGGVNTKKGKTILGLAGKGMNGIGLTMIALGISLLFVVSAIKKIADLPVEKAWNGVAVLSVMLILIMVVLAVLSRISGPAKVIDKKFGPFAIKKSIPTNAYKGIGSAILLIGLGLMAIAKAVERVSNIEPEKLKTGLIGLAVALGTVVAALAVLQGVQGKSTKTFSWSLKDGINFGKTTRGSFIGIALAIDLLIPAMLALASTINKLSKIDPDRMASALKGFIAGMATLMLVIYALYNGQSDKTTKTKSFNRVSNGFGKGGTLDYKSSFSAKTSIIGAAAALTVMVPAILALSKAIERLGKLNPDQMATALKGFVAGMATLMAAVAALYTIQSKNTKSTSYSKTGDSKSFSHSKSGKGSIISAALALTMLVPAMLALSKAIERLGQVDPVKMGSALKGFVAGFATLTASLAALSLISGKNTSSFSISKEKGLLSSKSGKAQFLSIALAITLLSPAMLALSKSLEIVSKIDADKMAKSVASFAISFGAIVASLGILNRVQLENKTSFSLTKKKGLNYFSNAKTTILTTALSITLLTPAILALAEALAITGAIDDDVIVKATASFSAAFGIVSVCLGILNKMAGGSESNLSISKSGLNFSSTSSGIMQAAIAMSILAPALNTIADVIKKFSEINIEDLKKGEIAFAATVGIVTAALGIMAKVSTSKVEGGGVLGDSMQKVATSMLILSAAILLLAPGLKILGSLGLPGLAVGLGAVAGAMTIFLVAANKAKVIGAEAMFKLASAFDLFSVGVSLIGSAVLAVGSGVMLLTEAIFKFAGLGAETLAASVANIGMFINGIILLIPEIGKNLLDAIYQILMKFFDIMEELGPRIKTFIIGAINGFCDVVIATIPRLVDAGMQVILALVRGIADNIGEIVKEGIRAVENFIRGITEALPGIIDAGLDFIVGLIGGIGRGIKEHSAEIGSAVGEFVGAMYKGLADGIASFWRTITPFVNDLETLESERIIKGAQAINAIFGVIFTGTVLGNIQKFFAFFGGVTVEKLGEQLAAFGACFAQFSDHVKNVDPAALAATSGALDSFARVLVGIGVSGFNTFDFAIIGPEFALFGKYFADFATSIRSLTAQDIVQSTILAMMMKAILTVNLPRHGGLVDWIMGSTNNYSYVGADLALLAKNLLELRQYIKDFTPADAEQAAIMGQVMRSLLEVKLPRQGGLAQVFAGDNSMSTIGPQLVPFAENLADYIDQLRKMKLSDQDKTNAEIMKEVMTALFGVKLPNQGGLAGLIMGENSLEVIGPQITPFAVHMTHFFNEMRRMGLTEQDTANTKIMMESVKEIFDYHFPNQGGLAGLIMGENSLEVVGPQITPFAVHMTHFFNEMRRMGLTDQDTVNTKVMMESVKELFSVELPKQGGVVQWWTGENNLGTIAPQIALFGEGFSKYVKAIQGSGAGDAARDSETVTKALKDLFAIDFSSAKGDFWQGGYSDIILAAQQLPLLGAGVGGFFKAIQDVNTSGYNVSDVIGMINAVAILGGSTQRSYKDVGNELKELGNSLKIFSKDVQEAGGDTSFVSSFENTFLDIIRICEENQVRLHDVASGITNSFISGLTHYDGRDVCFTITQYFSDAISGTIATFKAYAGPFSESGQEMVKELIVSFQNLETSIKQFHDDTEALTDSSDITNNFEQMLASMLEISNRYKDSIHAGGNDLITGFISGFTHVEGRDAGFTISSYISEALNDTVEVIKRYSGPFSDSGKEMAQNLITEFQNLETSMKQFHTDTEALTESSDITNNFEAMLQSLVDLSVSYTGKIHTSGSDLIASFISSLTHYDGRDTGFTVVTYFSGVMSESIEEIGSYQNSAKTAGANFVQGLIQGMQSKATELKNVVNTLAGISIRTTMEVLDEHSPSRVMYKLGAYAIEGFVNGMKDEAGSVGEVAQTMASAVAAIGKDLPDYTVSFGDEAYIATALALKGVTVGTAEYEEAVSSAAAANLKFATSLYAATDEYKTDKEEVAKLTEELQKLREEEEKASNKYSEAVAKAESETGKAAEYMQSKWDKAKGAIAGVGGALGDQIIDVLGAYMTSLDIYDSMEEGIDKLAYNDVVTANKSALDGLIDSMDDSTDAAKEQKEAIKSVVDELVNARSESKNLIKGFNNDVKEAEETVKSSADAIMDKEDELAKKNQEMFDKIVKQWKDYIKKIKDAVKQYTDIFSGVADSIDLYAERSKPEELQLTEHETFEATEMESKADAEKELADAQRDLATAQAQSDAVQGKSLIALKKIEDANNRIAEAKQKIQEIDQRNAEIAQENAQKQAEIAKRNAEIDAENARKKYEQTAEYTAEEMMANMDAALQKYRDYSANVELIEKLDFNGPAKEYVKELVRGGYSNADQIAKIVSAAMSDLGADFITKFNESYLEKSQYESESYRQSIVNKMQETQEWSNKIASLREKGLNKDLINEMIDQGPDNSQLVNMIYGDVQRDGEAAISYWNDLYGDIETNSNNIANTITATVSGLADVLGVSATAIVQAIMQANSGNMQLSVYGEQLRNLLASNAELSRLWANIYGENLNKWTPDMEDSRVVFASKLAAAAVNEEINRLNKESNGLFAIQNGLINYQELTQPITEAITTSLLPLTEKTESTVVAPVGSPSVPVADALKTITESGVVKESAEALKQNNQTVLDFLTAVTEFITYKKEFDALFTEWKDKFDEFVTNDNVNFETRQEFLQTYLQTLLGYISTLTQTVYSAATMICTSVTNALSQMKAEIYSQMARANAAEAQVKSLQNQIASMSSAMVAGVRSGLGIHSPSTEFEKIGKYINLGLAKGLNETSGIVNKAMPILDLSASRRQAQSLDFSTTQRLASGISPNATSKLDEAIRSLAAVRQEPASNNDYSTQNNTFNITGSDPREIANQVNVILQKKAVRRRESWA